MGGLSPPRAYWASIEFQVFQWYSAALLWRRVAYAHIELMLIIESGWKSRLLLLHRAVRWVSWWAAREDAGEPKSTTKYRLQGKGDTNCGDRDGKRSSFCSYNIGAKQRAVPAHLRLWVLLVRVLSAFSLLPHTPGTQHTKTQRTCVRKHSITTTCTLRCSTAVRGGLTTTYRISRKWRAAPSIPLNELTN